MAYVSMGEAHRRITEYLNRFCDAVSYQDSSMLCRLLSFSSNSPSLLSLADALNVFQDTSSLINHTPKFSEYGEIIDHLFRSLQSYRVGNLVEAYLAFEKFANSFVQEFRNWESAWALEALYVVCYEVRILAEKADKELTSNGKSPEKLKAAGSLLMKVFGVLAGKGPKRVGALYVTCQLFKTYFKLGTVNLRRSVLRSIEIGSIVDFEEFPRRDKVLCKFSESLASSFVFNENFPAADTKLSYALQHCNPKRERNIRMILKYLIPVKLSIGIIPKDELLQTYNLPEYMNVVPALRKGDLRLLRHALQEHEDRYVSMLTSYCTYLHLNISFFTHFIKCFSYIIHKLSDPARAHQLKPEVIAKALRWLEIDMDLDEVECIMTILIYKNLVKGYLAHKSKVVFLSKQDPFPKLNGKPVGS
ncbi:hypothetical protein Bca52824_016932 [Brassica carinata]|uniref:PCI domain-containing protein n=1 Tax=Brassica carinata TaxID=52824 RepID=A0A8X8AVP8_BRACI|nr:hypothetical protein Bca52824_016932 [Brassica carinata]